MRCFFYNPVGPFQVPPRTKKQKYQTIATKADYMPFCTSCGAEMSADKKFCTSCGAPMDQPAGPVTPAYPLPVQPVPAEKPGIPKKTLLIIGIVAVLVILVVAYVAGIPMFKAAPRSNLCRRRFPVPRHQV
jgi:hypothetical protein